MHRSLSVAEPRLGRLEALLKATLQWAGRETTSDIRHGNKPNSLVDTWQSVWLSRLDAGAREIFTVRHWPHQEKTHSLTGWNLFVFLNIRFKGNSVCKIMLALSWYKYIMKIILVSRCSVKPSLNWPMGIFWHFLRVTCPNVHWHGI